LPPPVHELEAVQVVELSIEAWHNIEQAYEEGSRSGRPFRFGEHPSQERRIINPSSEENRN
jgi:hypothetical protein